MPPASGLSSLGTGGGTSPSATGTPSVGVLSGGDGGASLSFSLFCPPSVSVAIGPGWGRKRNKGKHRNLPENEGINKTNAVGATGCPLLPGGGGLGLGLPRRSLPCAVVVRAGLGLLFFVVDKLSIPELEKQSGPLVRRCFRCGVLLAGVTCNG